MAKKMKGTPDLIDRKHFDKALEDVIVVASAKMAAGDGPKLVNELTLDYLSKVREWLKEEPAVEAEPVVRAHWQTVEGHGGCQCSHCGCWDLGRTVYCPHCGALMTEQQPEMEGFMLLLKGGKPVDLAPVVHAHWKYKHRHRGGFRYRTGPDEWGVEHTIRVDDRWEEDMPYCSNCEKFTEDIPDPEYCPHCGALMDEEVSTNA